MRHKVDLSNSFYIREHDSKRLLHGRCSGRSRCSGIPMIWKMPTDFAVAKPFGSIESAKKFIAEYRIVGTEIVDASGTVVCDWRECDRVWRDVQVDAML